MKIHYQLDQLPRFHRAVITIGSFDGVHRGHQQLLARIQKMAERRGGESVVITFHPHPRSVLQPQGNPLPLLSTIEEKAAFCAAEGIEHLVVVPFSLAFSQQSPPEYIRQFLVRNFCPDRIVIGYDHRFGKDRAGDVDLLRHYAKAYHYEVVEIAAQEVDRITVSSTKIRQALLRGEVGRAEHLMGRPYELTGSVVEGQRIGRTIGYPTANLQPEHPHKLIPAHGIYAVEAAFNGTRYRGMLYIGDRPVVADGRGTTIELHLFDFAEDLYGQAVTVYFRKFLRGDVVFDGLDALKSQLSSDEAHARQVLDALAQGGGDAEENPDTAIVILNYNGRGYLERYLPIVLEHLEPNCRVVVADNASTDDSVAWLRDTHPRVKLLTLSKNFGFAAGYNEALRDITAEVYVLLNSDVRVTRGWLGSILPLFEDAAVGAVQPKILAEHAPECFEYAGAAGGYLDILGYPFCRGRIFGKTERDEGQYDCLTEIFWASGAALFVRAKAFHDLQGFEPEYFAHSEEIDLCWRMKRAGYRILAEPSARVYHVGGGTLAYDTPRKAYLNFRNTLVTSFKNESTSRLLWLLPVRLLLDGAAACLFASQGKWAHILSILRAHFHFYSNLPLWAYRRARRSSEINAGRVAPPRTDCGRLADSVALHYYLLSHTRFSEVVIPQVRVEAEPVAAN